MNFRYIDPPVKQEIDDYIDKHQLTNVIVSNVCLDKSAYLKAFSDLDCYVSVSNGEGFSIQPREAMALGIPTIVSNNTAQKTIAESGLVLSVDTSHITPAVYDWNKTRSYGEWHLCSEDEVAEALLSMYHNYSKHLENAQEAREWSAQFDFPSLLPLYRTLLNPQTIELGAENCITDDKIVTTSPELLEKYQQLFPEKFR
jgi:glycosyltransferase involved in cell wall biosynthesis